MGVPLAIQDAVMIREKDLLMASGERVRHR
jgi:hypothetical protein